MREALQRAIVEVKVSKTGKNMPASWPLLWGLTLNPENSSEESYEVHLIGENEREKHLSISVHSPLVESGLGALTLLPFLFVCVGVLCRLL